MFSLKVQINHNQGIKFNWEDAQEIMLNIVKDKSHHQDEDKQNGDISKHRELDKKENINTKDINKQDEPHISNRSNSSKNIGIDMLRKIPWGKIGKVAAKAAFAGIAVTGVVYVSVKNAGKGKSSKSSVMGKTTNVPIRRVIKDAVVKAVVQEVSAAFKKTGADNITNDTENISLGDSQSSRIPHPVNGYTKKSGTKVSSYHTGKKDNSI